MCTSRRIAAVLVAALVIFSGRSTSAADVVWNVAGPADWNTAANWNPARVPTGTDNAKLDNGGTATVTGNSPAFTALFIGNSAIVNVNSGGTLSVSADAGNNESFVVGDGTGNGQLNVSGTGIVTEAGAGNFYVGDTTRGLVNQTGGTVNLFTNPSANSWLRIGAGANGEYTLSGGSLTTTNATNDLVLGNSGYAGTFDLNGGTATIGGAIYSFGPSVFNFNGGTLRPGANESAILDASSFMSGLTTANVRNGGAIIDTNGFNVTIAQPLVHSTISGDNATDGGLTKLGAGTLTLTGTSTYTGATNVNGGTLLLPFGTITNGATYTISGAGSTLGTVGSGVVGQAALYVGNGATINVKSGGLLETVGPLAVGGFQGNGTLVVDGTSSNSTIAVSGLGVGAVGNTGSVTFQNHSTGNTLGFVQLGYDGPGNNFSGSLSVLSGSTVGMIGLDLLSPINSFAETGQSATLTVDGTGSSVTTSQGVINSIGQDKTNQATLTVSNNGMFTVGAGGGTALNPTGVIFIEGGIVDLKSLTNNGGFIDLFSGSLSFIGSFNVGVGGPLGQILTLDGSKSLTLTGTTTIDQFRTLTLSGGTLSTGNLVNNGTLNFTSGTLDITGAGGLTIGGGGALGSFVALGAGSNLNVTGPTVLSSSTATLTVNGGSFSTNSYLQSFGSVTTNGSVTVVQEVLNYSGATFDVTGGSFNTPFFDNFGSLVVDAGTIAIGSSGLTNNSGAFFYIGPNKTASIGSASTNAGEIQLGGASALLTGAGTLANTGLLHGDGVIADAVTNNAGGEIRAESGKRIKLTAANGPDAGNINLQGGAAEFSQPLTIAGGGQINGQGNLIVPAGSNTGIGANQSSVFGLSDNGTIQFSGGDTNIYGSVNLPGVVNMSGTITGPGTGKLLIGAGANTVSFYGDVWNNGNLFRTTTGSYAVFFGTVHGASSFSGGGTVDFEGTHQVGNSPAVIGIGGNAIYGVASALDINLGGTTPGNSANNYAQVNIVANVNLGGTLNLVPYNGFIPVSGDKFTVMTYANESGSFSSITGTSPAPGLTYSAVYLPTSLVILTTTTGDKTWGVDASGNASVGSNWVGGIAPGGIGDSAAFTTIITANRTVTLDADTTVGTLKFDSPNNYLIAGTHTLTLQAAGSTAAAINVSGAHGNGAHTISAPIALASNLNVMQNSGGPFTVSGALNDVAGKQINVSDSGVMAITGPYNLGNGTALSASGTSTLRFGLTSGAATIGTGVTAMVNSSATLELAGSVSALSSGPNRVNIMNNSNSNGLLISGTQQQVGGIDGAGTTRVNAGSDLTANHIVQGALVIGGTATSPGLVTIDASDSSGNPLAQSSPSGLSLDDSLQPNGPFAAGAPDAASLDLSSAAGFDGDSIPVRAPVGAANLSANAQSVPEPSGLLLLALGGVVCLLLGRWNFSRPAGV